MTWSIDPLQAEPEQLLGVLVRRLRSPEAEGPLLDDRNGEAPEDVFVTLAQDEGFRKRLDKVIAGYFERDEANPADEGLCWAIRSMLRIVGRRSLMRSGDEVRAWLARHDAVLRADRRAVLGRAALDALATAMPHGTEDGRRFWLTFWRNGPTAWQWRAFVGLRLQDPEAAAREIPEVFRRLRAQNADARAMLLGMWNQSTGKPALVAWVRTTEDQRSADEVRRVLRGLVPPEDFAGLRRPTPRRAWRSMIRPEALEIAA